MRSITQAALCLPSGLSPELTYPLAARLDDGGWTTIEGNFVPSVTPWKEGAESDRMRLTPGGFTGE